MTFSKKAKAQLLRKYGSWALVTGASSGIGEALAIRLAEVGFKIILNSRDETKLEQLANQLEFEFGIETEVLACDISDRNNVSQVMEFTESFNIGLVILAAGFGTSGLFLESDLEEELQMLRLNCESLFILTHHFTRRFADKGNGGIVLMSSIVGFQGTPYASHYAATKAYVQSLAEGLYHELRGVNVDILAASPGPVNSGFADRADMKMGNVLKPSEIAVPILKALGNRSTIFPGNLTKLLMFGLRTVPRWGKIKIMKMVMQGMTKHQNIAVD